MPTHSTAVIIETTVIHVAVVLQDKRKNVGKKVHVGNLKVVSKVMLRGFSS